MKVSTPILTPELKARWGKRGVAGGTAFEVPTYRQLVQLVATLAYINGEQLLFFRGQGKDFRSKGRGTTLYPAIYREDNLPAHELAYRFARLEQASDRLVGLFRDRRIEGYGDVARKRYIQWSILQHYDVVPTPLLDLTHSLRVACSFAQLAGGSPGCYVYALGMPYLDHRISIDSEQEVVNVRLLSICPPAALRPHFQEGYMAGTPDVTTNFESKTELDFRNRLIAKFAIPRAKHFWGANFQLIPRASLFPDADRVGELCDDLRDELAGEYRPAKAGWRPPAGVSAEALGLFMKEWASLEASLLNRARGLTGRNVSMREAIQELRRGRLLTGDQAKSLEMLRRFRNTAVHRPQAIAAGGMPGSLAGVRRLSGELIDRLG